MKRVVITGLGIVSCLGNDREAVTKSLKEGISGIRYREDFAEMGLKCNVGATLDIDPSEHIDRKYSFYNEVKGRPHQYVVFTSSLK